MTKAVPRQKGLPRGVKVCKIHYKYAKKSHTFGFKKGSLKRIFLIIYRYDYYNFSNIIISPTSEQFGNIGANIANNGPVDHKKNAFFGVPFEGIIWYIFSLFCPQNLYKKTNLSAKMGQHG